MTAKTLTISLMSIVIGALAASLLFFVSKRPRQTTIFVGEQSGFGKDAVTFAHWDWFESFVSACPNAAFMTDEDGADYKLMAAWTDNRWDAATARSDGAMVYMTHGTDYAKILRDACAQVRADANRWARPETQVHTIPQAAITGASKQTEGKDRYELRDIRNGNTISSAIFDKETGRVWVWTTLAGKSGQKTGSAFISEDVYSYSNSPAPGPN